MPCAHYWIANSGAGGEPRFALNRQLSSEALMHVKCLKCDERTWFSAAQWQAIPAVLPPQ